MYWPVIRAGAGGDMGTDEEESVGPPNPSLLGIHEGEGR